MDFLWIKSPSPMDKKSIICSKNGNFHIKNKTPCFSCASVILHIN